MTTAPENNVGSPSRTALARISINTICMYGAWAVRKISILVLAMVIGRVAGISDFGVYCLALVWMEAGIRLAEFGTDILVIRETSARHSSAAELAGSALIWRIVAAGTICPVMIFAAGKLNGNALLPEVVSIMGIGMIAQAVGNLYLSLVQGRERVDLHAFAQAATSIFGLILGLIAVIGGYGLYGLALAYSIRGTFSLLLGMGMCRRLDVTVRPRTSISFMHNMLKNSAPIGINRFMTILYLGSGMTILQFVHGEAAVGLFAAAMKIFEACSAFGTLTMVAAFPTIARLHAGSKDGLSRTAAAIVRLFCWAGIPMSLVVALSARILLSFFGHGFSSGAPALAILMAAVPFSLNSELAERLAYANHDQKRVLLIRFIGISLNMLILFMTVVPFGYLAPAMAILGAEIAMLALFLPLWTRYVPRTTASCLPGNPLTWRIVPAGIPSGAKPVRTLAVLSCLYLLIEKRAGEWLRFAFRYAVASVCMVTGLCRLCRKFYLHNKIVVVSYHRIDDGDDPLQMNISPGRFGRQMQFLHRHFNCIDLDTVAAQVSGPTEAPGAAAAITFDDGYRGDLQAMKDALSDHQIAAAIFVAPGLLEDARLAWWETLAAVIREAAKRGFRISAGRSGPDISLEGSFVRRICTRAIAEKLRLLSPDERNEHLGLLAGATGIDPHTCIRPDTFLGWQELKSLAGNTAVTVGSHTQTHCPVTDTDEAGFREELRRSAESIRARLNCNVRHFAYPSGSAMRTSPARTEALRAEGFVTASTNVAGITDGKSNPYKLRRIGISNEPLPIFAARVSGVFEMLKCLLNRKAGRRS